MLLLKSLAQIDAFAHTDRMTHQPTSTSDKPLLASATVLLLRDNPTVSPALEVFMVKRNYEIDTFSGALIFPGGKVCKGDYEALEDADGLGPQVPDDMLPYYVSAVRECFEECGILLARQAETGELVSAERLAMLEPYRARLDKDEISMAAFLRAENLKIALDELVAFAHWITPRFVPKRFDTHFLLARAPKGQIALHDGREAVSSVWINPAQALQDQKEGKRTIIFPTRCNLEKLALSQTTQDAMELAAREEVVTVLPEIGTGENEGFLCIPENAGYPTTKEPLGKMRQ